jgi:4-hydroxy-tetrahydrodipicolinate synthase
MGTPSFGSILTAMVTPFDASGEVDESATARLLQHLFDHGSDGVVVCGTTGEAATLDDDEHLGFIEFVVTEVRRSYPGKTVVAGVGSNDTRHAIKLTEAATALRPDGLLSVNPYYNRPSRRGIVRHYEEISRATDLPILLYNIPQRTGADLPNEFLAELAQIDRIVGVKQANAANLGKVDGLMVYAGNDENLIDVLEMDGAGGILTLSHVFGDAFRRMVEEPAQRAAIHESLQGAYRDMGIAPLAVTNKAALNLIGIEVGGPRLPYVELDEPELQVVRALLERHHVLQAVRAY